MIPGAEFFALYVLCRGLADEIAGAMVSCDLDESSHLHLRNPLLYCCDV